MNINKIIEKIETRKKVTKKYFEDCKKIFDFISSLNIDVNMTSKNIRARYELYRGNSDNLEMDSTLDYNDFSFVVAIRDGICFLYTIHYYGNGVERFEKQKDCVNDLGYYIDYINIEDMNTAIFSILTQLENIGNREDKANELKKIVEVIQK